MNFNYIKIYSISSKFLFDSYKTTLDTENLAPIGSALNFTKAISLNSNNLNVIFEIISNPISKQHIANEYVSFLRLENVQVRNMLHAKV